MLFQNLHPFRSWRSTALLLLALVAVTCLVNVSLYALHGTSPIWNADSLQQHYQFYVYLGQWVRSAFESAAAGNGFFLPLWTLDLGYGADNVVSMAAYIGDPLNWTSIAVPTASSETAYLFTLYARTLLAAGSFVFYCREKGFQKPGAFVGGFAYATCSWWTELVYQPFFCNPLITFPLVIAGLDRILARKSPALFIGSVAITCLNYFYFGYMTLLLCVAYYLVWVVVRTDGRSAVEKLHATLPLCIGGTVLALGISAVLLAPNAANVLQQSRLGFERTSLTLFTRYGDIYTVYKGLFGYGSVLVPDCIFGLGPVTIIAIVFGGHALKATGTHKVLMVCTAITIVGLVIAPLCKLMSGMAYVSCRWAWAPCFFANALAAASFPAFARLRSNRPALARAVIALVAAALLALTIGYIDANRNVHTWIGPILALVLVCGIALLSRSRKGDRTFGCLLVVLLCAGSFAGAVSNNSFSNDLYTKLVPQGSALTSLTADDLVTDMSPYVDRSASTTRDWRIDGDARTYSNTGLLTGLPILDFYDSMYIDGVDKLNASLGLSTATYAEWFRGIDNRGSLDYALGVRYLVQGANGNTQRVPSGFSALDDSVYESTAYRPLASLATAVVSESAYYSASAAQRQGLLAQAVVLPDTAVANDSDTSVQSGVNLIEDLESLSGTHVVDSSTSIPFQVHSDAEGEYLLELDGWDYSGLLETANFQVVDDDGTVRAAITPQTIVSHEYGGKTTWVLNLGELAAGDYQLTFTINGTGTYSFDRASIYVDTRSGMQKGIADSAQAGTTSFSFTGNAISCQTHVDASSSYLLLTTPYSTGWTATVDGQSAEIQKADVAFMAVEVPQGDHSVVLTYRTPYLAEGSIITVIALLASICLCRRMHARPEGR